MTSVSTGDPDWTDVGRSVDSSHPIYEATVFTGIVEALGSVESIRSSSDGASVTLVCETFASPPPIGSSIAVNGVCLTVTSTDAAGVSVDIVPETLARTNLGELRKGSTVNLERAMPASGRFDGHVVQGHVDAVGTVVSIRPEGTGKRLTIEVDPHLMRYVVEKGSITVDGVSLTVAGVDHETFEVALIPHTIDVTTFGGLVTGSAVNLEVDILAKYVERMMETGR